MSAVDVDDNSVNINYDLHQKHFRMNFSFYHLQRKLIDSIS